jgi:NADH-quinone oxidoreductase subunit C
METIEQLHDRLLAAFSRAEISLVNNPGPAAQHSLLLGSAHAAEIARFLRDDPALRLDYCSNVTGVDWPDKEVIETVKKTAPAAVPVVGAATAAMGDARIAAEAAPTAQAPALRVVEEKTKRIVPGHLEVVYHLYSMALKHGPVIIRLRTANRTDRVTLPSLTPIWRSCEFQEREVYDLFGVVFEGHPDLRRILMWDEFKDHPMRRDYVEPDDYEWEPTAHGEVLEKAKRQQQSTRENASAGQLPISD